MIQVRSSKTGVDVRRAARDCQGGRLLELGAAGNPVLVQIRVDNGPISAIVASPDGGRLVVTNNGCDTISVIDTGTCRVLDTIDDVNEPFAIAMGSRDNGRAYVSSASAAYDSIAVIDTSTSTVVETHPLALSVSDLAVSADGKRLYASRNGVRAAEVAVLDTVTGHVEVIDLAELSDLAPSTTTQCVRVSPDGARLYVATNGPAGGQLVVIAEREQSGDEGRARWRRKKAKKSGQSRDTPDQTGDQTGDQPGWRVVETLQIGLPIRDVALSSDGSVAYVASCCPEYGAVVDVIDTSADKIAGTCKIDEISGNVTGLTLSGDGARAYLIGGDGVTVLCTLTHEVIGTIGIEGHPSCAAESPDGKQLYIADYSGAVTVVPNAAAAPRAIESQGDEAAPDWGVPELLRCEPALA